MRVDQRGLRIRVAIFSGAIASVACGVSAPPGQPAAPSEPAPSLGALSGTLRLGPGSADGQPVDTALGPVVVMLAPLDSEGARIRPTQQFRIVSATDRFDPPFTTIAAGDFIVFVNDGAVSHRLFSASLGSDVHIPVSPADSTPPQRIERTGELRFFCSLHPDEHFSVLVTGDVFSAVVEPNGRFYIAPIPDGPYRLSIWSRRVEIPIRNVNVAGPSTAETIVLDAALVRR
jgi:plastocyanin